jgi:adenylate cyclase, class 1
LLLNFISAKFSTLFFEAVERSTMDDSFSLPAVIQSKNAFISYNILRIRELIRYLSPQKYELFQNIPFWLQVNLPGIPGFVDFPDTPRGIYRFFDSGFLREASKRCRVESGALRFELMRKPFILGLYLMGSSGTLAQTDHSDFDYWIITDSNDLSSTASANFTEKLHRIESWSRERYNQDVNLFVLPLNQVKANEFSTVDEESSGSAQRTLLKEEFYRTFIRIAGKSPFWTVMPIGLDEGAYQNWIQEAKRARHYQFDPDDYIDLGYLKEIHRNECLGAVLWQLYKARKYPAKSLIKAGLIAHYFFFMDSKGLLSDQIRQQFIGSKPVDRLIDPYAIVFKAVMEFFSAIDDRDGLELVKESILRRLSETTAKGSIEDPSPRNELMEKYLIEWGWDNAAVESATAIHRWSEADRLAFEGRIYSKISFLYELILRAQEESEATVAMRFADLMILKNRISAEIKKKPGKLPFGSAYFRSNLPALPLTILGSPGTNNTEENWSVYELTRPSPGSRDPIFNGPQLLRVIGWLWVNGFRIPGMNQIQFRGRELPYSPRRIEKYVTEIFSFLSETPLPGSAFRVSPKWERIIISPYPAKELDRDRLQHMDILTINSWGEIFFETVDLKNFHSKVLQCSYISEYLWKYSKERGDWKFPYRIIELGKHTNDTTAHLIEAGYNAFVRMRLEQIVAGRDTQEGSEEENDEPFIDLL